VSRVGEPTRSDPTPPPRRRLVYGRRQGHRLSPSQIGRLARLLPGLRVPEAAPGTLDPRGLFGPAATEVWLEIGFGAGEHLAWQAARHPEIGLIGAEPFVNGVAKLLAAIESQGLANVRIHDDDACELLDRLAPATLARVFILFPDPWPKTRHHKRRIIQHRTVTALARVLRPGGEMGLASDIAAMTGWMMEHILRDARFEWLAETAADWRARPADWPPTRYETKAIEAGRVPVYLRFRRT
jgi:tRNA (guanine-N7-)-methyltransferase